MSCWCLWFCRSWKYNVKGQTLNLYTPTSSEANVSETSWSDHTSAEKTVSAEYHVIMIKTSEQPLKGHSAQILYSAVMVLIFDSFSFNCILLLISVMFWILNLCHAFNAASSPTFCSFTDWRWIFSHFKWLFSRFKKSLLKPLFWSFPWDRSVTVFHSSINTESNLISRSVMSEGLTAAGAGDWLTAPSPPQVSGSAHCVYCQCCGKISTHPDLWPLTSLLLQSQQHELRTCEGDVRSKVTEERLSPGSRSKDGSDPAAAERWVYCWTETQVRMSDVPDLPPCCFSDSSDDTDSSLAAALTRNLSLFKWELISVTHTASLISLYIILSDRFILSYIHTNVSSS